MCVVSMCMHICGEFLLLFLFGIIRLATSCQFLLSVNRFVKPGKYRLIQSGKNRARKTTKKREVDTQVFAAVAWGLGIVIGPTCLVCKCVHAQHGEREDLRLSSVFCFFFIFSFADEVPADNSRDMA